MNFMMLQNLFLLPTWHFMIIINNEVLFFIFLLTVNDRTSQLLAVGDGDVDDPNNAGKEPKAVFCILIIIFLITDYVLHSVGLRTTRNEKSSWCTGTPKGEMHILFSSGWSLVHRALATKTFRADYSLIQ
jgi:hypothetical protein